ncbi:Protein phosphatase 2C 6 [Rachicladosporium monterosium]|uniref:Protein phosphatase 2C 6 n=1 Tax=Rachicladosporium monterosium TaxID=1507873 RepID=A0ABR0KYS3_9PEZI|nr:Protein phosphatase 2C 6 [Rachicladosporium monterosium]
MSHHAHPYSIRNALRAVFREPCSSRPSISQRRAFHEYFVTHLPSSSLSPDKQHANHHRLPRDESSPHSGPSRTPAQLAQQAAVSRDTTIVRIPIKSAKHHFGAGVSRGSRPYNEDTYQAGTIEMPAFAKRQPVSLTRTLPGQGGAGGGQSAKSESGDPQVFYFVDDTSLDSEGGIMGEQDAEDLQKSLVSMWRETVGGYFKRFKPEHFPAVSNNSSANPKSTLNSSSIETVLAYAFLKADLDFTTAQASKHTNAARAQSSIDDPVLADRPLNDNDVLFQDDRPASQNLRAPRKGSSPDLAAPIGGAQRFKGGSTASVALISTPTPVPFWHPASPSTLIVAHAGDTRILLSRTSDGKALPLTTNHHPDAPVEANRLRRYAASFVTDSFGEERMGGLANTRAFGDIGSKRLGVSAEPQITRVDLAPAEYSFVVMVSDGVSGHLTDQEILDVVKEARTPAQGAGDLAGFAVEVSEEADNATALVVRLGGWERRNEGGGGSLGTKEQRDYRRQEAMDPRARRQ